MTSTEARTSVYSFFFEKVALQLTESESARDDADGTVSYGCGGDHQTVSLPLFIYIYYIYFKNNCPYKYALSSILFMLGCILNTASFAGRAFIDRTYGIIIIRHHCGGVGCFKINGTKH